MQKSFLKPSPTLPPKKSQTCSRIVNFRQEVVADYRRCSRWSGHHRNLCGHRRGNPKEEPADVPYARQHPTKHE